MSHFAKVESGVVTEVIVAEQGYIDTLPDSGLWVQTSYNTLGGKHYDPDTREEDGGVPLRKNYAGIGYTYDPIRDAFIPPKEHDSWVLNEDTCLWEAPQNKPSPELDEDGKLAYDYGWDETAYAETGNGWVKYAHVD